MSSLLVVAHGSPPLYCQSKACLAVLLDLASHLAIPGYDLDPLREKQQQAGELKHRHKS